MLKLYKLGSKRKGNLEVTAYMYLTSVISINSEDWYYNIIIK